MLVTKIMVNIMSDYRIRKHIKDQSAIYHPFLEPMVDQVMEKVDLSALPAAGTNTQEEKKAKYRESVSDLIYDTEGRFRIRKGFELVIANLGRVSGGELVRKELAELGRKQFDQAYEAVRGNEDKIVERMAETRNAIMRGLPKSSAESATSGLPELFAQMISLRDEWGVGDPTFQIMYHIGCLLLAEQHIEEAECVFYLLSVFDAKCHEVWFCLGLCLQRQQKWPQAIAYYTMAILIRPANILCYLNSSTCYQEIHDSANAIYMLDIADAMLKKTGTDDMPRDQLHAEIVKRRNSI